MSIIAVISTPPPITGQATAGRMLVEAFAAQGIDHHVVSTASSIGQEAPALSKARRTLSLVAKLAATRTAHPPILYLQMGQGPSSIARDAAILMVAAARRWPVVGHVHGGGWRSGLEATPAPLRRLYLRVLGRAKTVIVLTPRLTAMFENLLDGTDIVVVGNGVEQALANEASVQPATWAPDATIAFVSNLLPDKGVDTVIEAARQAHEAGQSLRFVLAGNDPAGIADSLPPNTTWAGVVGGKTKHELLASAQLFVLPTRYRVEGQPISILEAYHFGLPVVSSDQGGVADIVDEANGVLIDPDSPQALLAAIEGLTGDQDRWETMSAHNRAVASERHSTRKHLDEMFRLLGLDG